MHVHKLPLNSLQAPVAAAFAAVFRCFQKEAALAALAEKQVQWAAQSLLLKANVLQQKNITCGSVWYMACKAKHAYTVPQVMSHA
jgi:hypothetical protein